MYLIINKSAGAIYGLISKVIEGGRVAWVCLSVLIEILEFKLFCKQEESVTCLCLE